jgi:methionyl-tRNA synthetase
LHFQVGLSLRHIDTFADSDFTWEKFEDAYNNELANDLGNLVQRLATLISKNNVKIKLIDSELDDEFTELMDKFEFSKALDYVWEKVQDVNKRIDEEKPWALAKEDPEKARACLSTLVRDLLHANKYLALFLPDTSKQIAEIFEADNIEPPKTPLFPKN